MSQEDHCNACPITMCLADEEIVDHLLLNCKVALGLWSAVLCWFGCGWVLPSLFMGCFEAWHLEAGLKRKGAVEDDFFVNVMDHPEGKELLMLRNEDTISLVEVVTKKTRTHYHFVGFSLSAIPRNPYRSYCAELDGGCPI